MDEKQTLVIFRIWVNATKSVIALFPEIKTDVIGRNCLSYQHVGLYGAAVYGFVIRQSRLATESEYRDLFNELIKIGYNLKVRKRWNRRNDMTKKDYIKIATVIKKSMSYVSGAGLHDLFGKALLSGLAEDLAIVFQSDNDNFNQDKFLDACSIK